MPKIRTGAVNLTALNGAFVRQVGVAPMPKAAGAFCFTWDDGYPNWLAIAQAASLRGQRHTFCITSNHIDAVNGITTADIRAIAALGHEIACHSKTHLDHAAASTSARLAEMDDSLTALEAITGLAGKVTTYVYPFGSTQLTPGPARNNTTDRELWGRYDRVRDTSLTGFTQVTDRGEAFLIPCQAWVQNRVLAAIDSVQKRPLIYSVFAHWPDNLIGGSPDVTWTDMIAAMDYAQAQGVPCVTLSEAFPAGGIVMDPCLKRGIGAWRTIGDSGAITNPTMVNGPTNIKNRNLVRITPTTAAYCAITQHIPVTPGLTYQIGYMARAGADGAGNAGLTGILTSRFGLQTGYDGLIAGYDEGTSISGRTKYLMSSQGDKSGAWNIMGSQYVIPAGVRYVEVQIGMSSGAGQTVEVAPHIWVSQSKFGNFA